MDLTRFALEKRVVTATLVVVLLLVGIQAFFALPRSEDPGFVIRVAMVTTYFPGASPELSLIHISEPTRPAPLSRMPSSA